jgi:RHS repeat-associated protein
MYGKESFRTYIKRLFCTIKKIGMHRKILDTFSSLMANTNRYTFSGKEKQTIAGLNYLDFGARMLETEFGRWLSLDPLAIKYYSLSPYAYCANNPLKYIDPDGRKIRNVTYKNGQISYNKTAIKNGTNKYLEARMQTPSGRASITSMLESKQTYNLMVTDKIIVNSTDKGRYAIVGGITVAKNKLIVVSTNTTKPANATQDQLKNAATLDDYGNLTSVNVNINKLDRPLSDPNGKDQQSYNAAYNDSGMAQFEADPNNAYQSTEEQINGIGAHEEEHLTDENIQHQDAEDVYATEKPAFEAEIRARQEWQQTQRQSW